MKFLLVLLSISTFFSTGIFACTTFLINSKGEIVFGRNYDWSNDKGFVNTNLKGLFKTSLRITDGKQISWVSKYGSITFNQYGKEFATGGMNEKGLVVEIMWLNEAIYAKNDDRAALQDLQWVQYQLDNAATVEEVLATDSFIRVSATSASLHFLVADANGCAATIEFLNGKMVAHYNDKLSEPVLTNSTYQSSIESYKKKKINDNSLERFSTACTMVNSFKKNDKKLSVIDYSFSILEKVAQGNYTKWSIVYDIKRKKIYFFTNKFKSRKTIDLGNLNFSCKKTKALSLNMNLPLKGNITKQLAVYSNAKNEKLVRNSINATAATIAVSEEEIEAYIKYPSTISCKN